MDNRRVVKSWQTNLISMKKLKLRKMRHGSRSMTSPCWWRKQNPPMRYLLTKIWELPWMQALALTFSEQPMAMNMSFQRQYAERYDWLAAQFKDWAFHLLTSFFYYEDNASLKDEAKKALHMSMAAFGGMAPTYHIALFDKPTIVWDFHSLLLGIQMMFSFMLTDEDSPLKLCKHCQKVFASSRQSNLFCSPRCKNQYNVYKSRKKNKEQE